MIELALLGAGQRGMIYATYAMASGLARVVAVAETDASRREAAARLLHVPDTRVFEDADALLRQGKLGDAAIIATMDRAHYGQAMRALELGYDLILEKPISPDAGECMRIERLARDLGRKTVVCHVLRYSPFFRELKRIVVSREMGDIVTIQHNENIGNFHMAHSFVRGNWRKASESSPIILQKSCHDLDLLVWLTDSPCALVSAFGDLRFFRAERAPEGATARCRDCPLRDACRFSCYLCYPPVLGSWPATVLCVEQTPEALQAAMDEGPYGRCVFHCDNDVCDHMTLNLAFKNGVTATFNLSAFTSRMTRTIKIMCEHGEIRGNELENRIEVIPFATTGTSRVEERVIHPEQTQGAHSGGDVGIMNDFFALMRGDETAAASDISRSVESHYIACAADIARRERRVVDMDAFRASLAGEALP